MSIACAEHPKLRQVDEPALREGLPLKAERWGSYLDWAVNAFKLATTVAKPSTQIVTHLCYSEFADILEVRLPSADSGVWQWRLVQAHEGHHPALPSALC